jgi:hypothetical protein
MKGHERDHCFWGRLTWSLGGKGRSVRTVQIADGDGKVHEFTTQHEVHKMIWTEVHQSCYHLVEETPICQG